MTIIQITLPDTITKEDIVADAAVFYRYETQIRNPAFHDDPLVQEFIPNPETQAVYVRRLLRAELLAIFTRNREVARMESLKATRAAEDTAITTTVRSDFGTSTIGIT